MQFFPVKSSSTTAVITEHLHIWCKYERSITKSLGGTNLDKINSSDYIKLTVNITLTSCNCTAAARPQTKYQIIFLEKIS